MFLSIRIGPWSMELSVAVDQSIFSIVKTENQLGRLTIRDILDEISFHVEAHILMYVNRNTPDKNELFIV